MILHTDVRCFIFIVLAATVMMANCHQLLLQDHESQWKLNCSFVSDWRFKDYELVISSVYTDYSNFNGTFDECLYQTDPSDVCDLLADRCNGENSCSWSREDYDGEKACPLIVEYECFNRREQLPNNTAGDLQPSEVKLIGCDTDYRWTFQCNASNYEEVEISLVEPVECCKASSCSPEKAFSLKNKLYWKCHKRSSCSLNPYELDSTGERCGARVYYSCRQGNPSSDGPPVITAEGDLYTKVIEVRKHGHVEALNCYLSDSLRYEIEVKSVDLSSTSNYPSCDNETRAEKFGSLSRRCNGEMTCWQFIEAAQNNEDCDFSVSYYCHRYDTTTAQFSSTTPYSYSLDRVVGCDLYNSWRFWCESSNFDMRMTIDIVSVEPLFCLNLPCSDEKALSIKNRLTSKCHNQNSCHLELHEMNNWGIRCAARVNYVCRQTSL